MLVLLVVISLILLTDYFGESPNSPLHSSSGVSSTVLSPIQSGASTVLSPVRDVAGWISTRSTPSRSSSSCAAERNSSTKELATAK